MKKISIDLPKKIPIRLRNSIDRYGFSYVLSKICGKKTPPRSFAFWIHGWRFSDELTAELLTCHKLPRNLTMLVRNDNEKQVLLNEGFLDVRIAGLPFAYVKKQHSNRHKNCLLAFPPHSSESERINTSQKDYMDYLESLKDDFESIYVSLYSIDESSMMRKIASSRGLNVIQGAKPDDANSLFRVRSLLDSFEYVTSNVGGSHMLYALYAGCKFSFSGPIYEYDESMFYSENNPHNHSKNYISSVLKLQSEQYLRAKFSEFFKAHPDLGKQDIEYSTHEIGERFLMGKTHILDSLGWTIKGQFNGYATGLKRRLMGKLSIADKIF